MLKNYLKIAFRNIWKNKVFSLIHILGLSIGLSAAFVIGAMVYYDLSFDTFHPDADRIYRVTTSFKSPGGEFYNAGVTVPLAQELRDMEIQGLETVSPFFTTYPLYVDNLETKQRFKRPQYVIYTDSFFFETFEYQWLVGNKENALNGPNEVVLSENRAKKYFPEAELSDIVGKSIVYQDTIHARVSGIVSNFVDRTDIVFEEFISLKTALKQDMTNSIKEAGWDNTNSASQLFIKLKEDAIPAKFQKTLTSIADQHVDPEMKEMGRNNVFTLQPLSDLHLNPLFGTFDFSESRTSMTALKGLLLLAIILIVLAGINFINLSTAQGIQRSKEIGIRKTLGSSRKQLIFQFLGETFILTVTAGIVSVFLAKWLLLLFRDFIPQGLTFEIFRNQWVLLGVILLLIVVTLFSGCYPALVLSKYRPVSVLKQQFAPNSDKGTMRKYLTVFQFVIAQVFIIATLLVGKQLNYILKKDMGFNTEAIAYFRTPWRDVSYDKRKRFVTQMEALPGISEVVLSGNPPASFTTMTMVFNFIDGDKEVNSDVQMLYGTSAFFKLYDLQLLAGRLPLNDTIQEYVINTSYLKVIGIDNPADAVGKSFKADNKDLPIVGVMDDFNQHSLKYGVSPMAFTGSSYTDRWTQFRTIHFKLNNLESTNWPETISKIEGMWNAIYPDSDFEYTFMDDTIAQFYESERKTSILLQWATGLAILISCLGLLGLVIHTTERRIKEIGIRKILGASVIQLNVLLSKEFLKLVFIAFIIAAPIAWYGLDYWLEGFAYKTVLSWWVFILSGAAMILITLIIISVRTVSSANSNPIKSLRTE